MANQKQVEHLLQGVTAWNIWRENHFSQRIDLSEANLFRADLEGADLEGVNLKGANLEGANLFRANLVEANLEGANLESANLDEAYLNYASLSRANLSRTHLMGADLIGVNLSDTNLTSADLEGAVLSFADLSGANFTDTIMGNTSIGDYDLRLVKGLESIVHRAPSPLSINTIYLSQGEIPEAFVRGTGAPDSFLDYMKALASNPIEYYTCFISYSSSDEALANRLYADLQYKGVRCWFAPEDMKIGDRIRSRIDESIRLYDKLLLVLSEHSITSNWVEYEVEAALAKERRENRTVLFPVRVDNDIIKSTTAWAAHIQDTRHIGNFCRWKDHDAYQQEFSRLLHDLKAESKA